MPLHVSSTCVRMNEFPLFLFPLGLFLFLGVAYLLGVLLLFCSVRELVKFLMGLVRVQLQFLFNLVASC
jgi:hypothetical protein